jgi:hypothetical protein
MVYHVVRGRKRQLLTRVLRAFGAAVESGLARLLPWVPRSSVQGELPRLGFPTRANFRLDDLFRRLQSSAHDLGNDSLEKLLKKLQSSTSVTVYKDYDSRFTQAEKGLHGKLRLEKPGAKAWSSLLLPFGHRQQAREATADPSVSPSSRSTSRSSTKLRMARVATQSPATTSS